NAAEVRAFSLFEYLRQRMRSLYDIRLAEMAALVRRRVLISTLGGVASAVVTLATLVLLVWLIVHGHLSLASAGAAAGAVVLLGGQMHGFGSGSASLYENALYMQDFSTFVKRWPPQGQDAPAVPLAAFSRLDAQGVSFRYPSRSTPVLQDIQMEVRKGEVIALVGENGSGKTTLAKILAGLYRPSSGTILWDGVPLEEADTERLRLATAVIFQEYARYRMTAGENIALGDVQRLADFDAIVQAARHAQADGFIESLPKGYDNILGSEYFGGANISLGQWQRVALARAYFRDAPFVILDEPSASLDPKAEAALFKSVRSLLEGRSVLLISHRFASVRDADRIYVLESGRVIESGSHDSLMALDGKYADMFRLQAAPYGSAAGASS
ncbi:MAG TPA: ABC transporter ATP-binding protein, partial [Acidimicrobiales bacterium]|nr:ABC transporter ATP-binding protein [Acidimicrobiales bacterium]